MQGKHYIGLLLCMSIFPLYSQNLVVNGGFEEYDICIGPSSYPEGFVNISFGSPDFLHACNDWSPRSDLPNVGLPYRDSGFMGVFTSFIVRGQYTGWQGAEYLTLPLKQGLLPGKFYRVKMSVRGITPHIYYSGPDWAIDRYDTIAAQPGRFDVTFLNDLPGNSSFLTLEANNTTQFISMSMNDTTWQEIEFN